MVSIANCNSHYQRVISIYSIYFISIYLISFTLWETFTVCYVTVITKRVPAKPGQPDANCINQMRPSGPDLGPERVWAMLVSWINSRNLYRMGPLTGYSERWLFINIKHYNPHEYSTKLCVSQTIVKPLISQLGYRTGAPHCINSIFGGMNIQPYQLSFMWTEGVQGHHMSPPTSSAFRLCAMPCH